MGLSSQWCSISSISLHRPLEQNSRMTDQSDQLNAQAPATDPSRLSPPSESASSKLTSALPSSVGPLPDIVPSPHAASPISPEYAWFARGIHEYIRSYITLADQKAAFFFASAAALLVFLYKDHAIERWLKDPRTWAVGDLFSFLGVVGLAVTALLTISVVAPRLKGSKRGRVFWEAIAEFPDAASYARDVSGATGGDLVADTLQHSFDLALVCRRKYRVLQRALWSGAVGLLATIGYLVLG